VSSDAELNQLTEKIIGAAIEVHRHLDPGLLESAYETCLAYELEKRGLMVERQKALPLVYKESVWIRDIGSICWLRKR
jgi:GxxExxY protein